MRIIIAIDIIEGRCVRLTKGDFSTKKVYDYDPVELARQLEDNGLKYLHLVDLEGAGGMKKTSFRILEKITSVTSLQVDFGGGLRSSRDVKDAFDSGAWQVNCGSMAVTDRPLFMNLLETWGDERIILSADCLEGKVVTAGWTESSEYEIKPFISDFVRDGIRYVTCTDIRKDGMLTGPSLSLYRDLIEIKDLKLIASGGISSVKDIEDLEQTGCNGAIIGKALYEGLLNLSELGRIC